MDGAWGIAGRRGRFGRPLVWWHAFAAFWRTPLIEDNSVRSASSTLTNLKVGFCLDRKNTLSLDALNLFNRQLSNIDHFYESQLKTENQPVADLHFHPAEPRTLPLAVRGVL